jgi:PIN domain nuclease of toxin-antitoxin system
VNMPLLLDTCAAIWVTENDPRLKPAALAEISAAGSRGETIYVSPISAWEIGNLARKRRFISSLPPRRWFDRLLAAPGVGLAEMPVNVLLESTMLPGKFHTDPADRIIAATAREYGYRVVTRDTALLDYAAEGYLMALAC